MQPPVLQKLILQGLTLDPTKPKDRALVAQVLGLRGDYKNTKNTALIDQAFGNRVKTDSADVRRKRRSRKSLLEDWHEQLVDHIGMGIEFTTKAAAAVVAERENRMHLILRELSGYGYISVRTHREGTSMHHYWTLKN